MTADNFCFYLQNRLIQTGQKGGQQYSDTSLFNIPWLRRETKSSLGQSFNFELGCYAIEKHLLDTNTGKQM